VVVGGLEDGEEHTYVCSLSSTEQGAGEGTGIPAAIGAVLHRRGSLGGAPGVHAPEEVVPVDELLELAGTIVRGLDPGGGGVPLVVEHVGPDGRREVLPLALG
jgi:saccharopine dehydrogenase (NAD+, L-lysine-forming)